MQSLNELMRALDCPSQAELGRRLGVDPSAVGKWKERGRLPKWVPLAAEKLIAAPTETQETAA